MKELTSYLKKPIERMRMTCCLFLIFLTACSGIAVYNPPTSPSPIINPDPTLTPSPTENPIHTLGQLVVVKGLTIALIQVAYNSDQLQVMFAAKNTGSDVVSPSEVSFSVTTAGGASLKLAPCMVTRVDSQKKLSSAPRFSGNLQPGEILKGTTCWDGAVPQNGNQVGYSPDYIKPAVFWDVSSAGKADVPAVLTSNTFTTPPHAQGESVALKDITISFDSVTLSDYLNVYFTIENRGSSTYKFDPPLAASHVSSPLDDSFSFRLSDGSPMGSGIFMNSTCQNVSTSTEVLPGQKKTLHLCFGNYDPVQSIPLGSLVSFIPNADQGGQVNWLTK
jgi:hypothetical protein